MSREPIPQDTALKLQLAAIVARETGSSFVELRWRRPQGGMGQSFHSCGHSVAVVELIEQLGGKTDIYVGAAPRICRSGRGEAVKRAWCLWADLDRAESIERLAEFDPLPSIIIRSGSGGAHAWWPLVEPLRAEWIKPATRRLAYRLGADMAAAERARVLRLPGTLNFKHDPPRPVHCTRLELDSHSVKDIVGGLPDPPTAARQPGRRHGGPVDESAAIAPLAAAVREAQPGSRNNLLFWAACRAAEDELDADDELREAALDAGLTEHEIAATLRSALSGRAAA